MKWWSAALLFAAIMLLGAGAGATQSKAKLPLGGTISASPDARSSRCASTSTQERNTVEAARSLVSAGLVIALQPASLLFLDERDRVTTVNVKGAWAERSNRVGKLRGKALTPTAEEPMEQLWRDR